MFTTSSEVNSPLVRIRFSAVKRANSVSSVLHVEPLLKSVVIPKSLWLSCPLAASPKESPIASPHKDPFALSDAISLFCMR